MSQRYLSRIHLAAVFAILFFSVFSPTQLFAQIESPQNIKPGTIVFAPDRCKLDAAAQSLLTTLSSQMSQNPSYKVVLTGTNGGSKFAQQIDWDRITAVSEFMSNQMSIDRNRFIIQPTGAALANTVNFQVAPEGEEGPSMVPPPFPNMRCTDND